MMTAGSVDLHHAVEQFLFREARLMDANDYDAWLELWAPECTYWVPCNDEGNDPTAKVSLIYANRRLIEDRVWRLKGLHAHTQRPRSRLTRVLSNVELGRVDAGEVMAYSTFMLTEVRKDETHVWAGRNEHVLLRADDGFRIASKKVILVNDDIAMSNLTFII
jgi:3-phenylpropionate/cinnamic acid dioxygenase small subunit